MDKQNIHYCFTVSEEQVKFLRSKKYKIDRMDCFMSLVELAERDKKLVPISKTQQVEILRGQVMVDNTQLSKLWKKDRKTVPKLLEAMEKLGISSSQKVGENRIHTIHSLTGWYVDGCFIANSFALKRNADNSAIIHADVPPAKVITSEDPDDKDKGEEGSASGNDEAKDSNEGKNPSVNGKVSLLSPQSNDSGNEGMSGGDGKSSDSPSNNISPQSADSPSPQGEDYGKQNEGRNDGQTSPQHVGLQPGTLQQKPNGYQNGYKPYNGSYKGYGRLAGRK